MRAVHQVLWNTSMMMIIMAFTIISKIIITAIMIITILLLVTRYAGTSRGRLCCRCLVTRTRSRRKRNRSDTSFLII